MKIALLLKHSLWAGALTSLLSNSGHFDVVGQAHDVLGCLTFIRDRDADLVIVDEEVLTPEARAYLLGARSVQAFSIIVLSESAVEATEDEQFNVPILPLSSSPEDLFIKIRSTQTIPDLVRRPRIRKQSAMGLSAREREIVNLVAKGLSNREIAEITSLREQSVKNLVSLVIRRLGCANRTQLALKLTQMAVSAQ
jgi:DNA-binding NarL/FixJ family response regulator